MYRIEWTEQNFAYELSCPHLAPDQIPVCFLWVSNGNNLTDILPSTASWFTFTSGTRRAQLNLNNPQYATCDRVSLIALFQKDAGPQISALPSSTELTQPLSALINGTPITSRDQYRSAGETDFRLVAQWVRAGLEHKVK
jgi:hypothetical protein